MENMPTPPSQSDGAVYKKEKESGFLFLWANFEKNEGWVCILKWCITIHPYGDDDDGGYSYAKAERRELLPLNRPRPQWDETNYRNYRRNKTYWTYLEIPEDFTGIIQSHSADGSRSGEYWYWAFSSGECIANSEDLLELAAHFSLTFI